MSHEHVAGARNRFTDASLALTGGAWTGHRYTDSVYDRLRNALTAATAKTAAATKSRPPCRIDVLNLLCDIDSTIGGWWPEVLGTADRLTKMREHQWAPHDTDNLNQFAARLDAWTAAARQLLGDTMTSVPLRKPCPACGAVWAYHHSAGENVRAYALRASDTGAECAACNATWTPEQYPFLAKLIDKETHDA